MHRQLCLAGDFACQVPGYTGIDASILASCTEHHQGTLVLLIHEAHMIALGQQHLILQRRGVTCSLSLASLTPGPSYSSTSDNLFHLDLKAKSLPI